MPPALLGPRAPRSYGTLSCLPPDILCRILWFLPLETTYLDLRALNRSFRTLSWAFYLASCTELVARNESEALADALRAIQTAARNHPDTKIRDAWYSPHPITHMLHDADDFEMIPEEILAPALAPPKPDVTLPASVYRLLSEVGFDITGRGNVEFFVEFASRLYACGLAQKEPLNYNEPGPSKFREQALELFSLFDRSLTVANMRSFLELGRLLWCPDVGYRYRYRGDMPIDIFAAFLKRFPKFCASPALKRLLSDLKGNYAPHFQLSSSQSWQVQSMAERWGENPEQWGMRFLTLLRDPDVLSPESVASVVVSVASEFAQTLSESSPGTDEDEEDPGEGTLDEAIRRVVCSISTRQHFPSMNRMVRVVISVAEGGPGYLRNIDAPARAAMLMDAGCGPLWAAEEDPREEIKAAIATVSDVKNLLRWFSSFVGRLVDIWTTAAANGNGPLARYELSELLPRKPFTAECMFYIMLATANYAVFLPFWRSLKPEGYVDADLAIWKGLLADRAPFERQRVRPRIAAAKKALLVKVKKESKKEDVVPAKPRTIVTRSKRR